MQVGAATELHVSIHGLDFNPGSRTAPFRTIQRAAEVAHPGDRITVQKGVYRERINPPRGGSSHHKRIVYQAAAGARVEIKGSEIIKGWTMTQPDVWQVTLPNSFFGSFNPYTNVITGDWFNGRGRAHHTGAVYLNGDWLTEAATRTEVLKPAGANPLWFAQVNETSTTLWAQFAQTNPNEQQVEINVRQTVFYPDQPGRNYLTVRGFVLRHAATPWAPPTAEQIGLLGTHWSKGWIIESNLVTHSTCTGITLGKYGDEFDNTSAAAAEGYVQTIKRAHGHPIAWTKRNIGHHVVRHNTIAHCEQAGIAGSLGAAFSTVTGNLIHDIHVRQLFTGAEMAGIKFHGAIDTIIRGNHIYRTSRGIWLDWMAQGTRVTGNLLHDNGPAEDLFLEVNHGPFVVDNNLLLSPLSLADWSQGGAFAHNLFAGKITTRPELSRATPYHPAHATAIAGLTNLAGGDHRFFNNIFLASGLAGYNSYQVPLRASGNVYRRGAKPYAKEVNSITIPSLNPAVKLVQTNGQWHLHLPFVPALPQAETKLVTTERLGQARVPNLPYVHPDGSILRIDSDYFGYPRSNSRPTPGPLEVPAPGNCAQVVW